MTTNIRCFAEQVFKCPGCGAQHKDDVPGPSNSHTEPPRYWRCHACGWGGRIVSRWLAGITIADDEPMETP